MYLFQFSTCFGHSCAQHQEKIAVSMRHWYLSLFVDGVWSADQTPPIQSDKYQCRRDTVIFSWWWADRCPKHVEKINKYIKQNFAPSWPYLRDYTGMHGQQNIKFWKINFWKWYGFSINSNTSLGTKLFGLRSRLLRHWCHEIRLTVLTVEIFIVWTQRTTFPERTSFYMEK